ncbi:MAG: M1 family metallopeptidase [Myxococcota bacterium]|nr:M1 family metallopeptidase [Myxococcota bacterium]
MTLAGGSALTFDDVAIATHAEDVVDYTLRAKLDPVAHTVHGEGTIAWRNRSAVPVDELWLHLYLNAFKNDRSAFLRERIGGRGNVPEDWGWIDVHKLVLRDIDRAATDLWPAAELHRPDAKVARNGDDEAEDETDVRVPLPWPIAPGHEVALDVVFDDHLPKIVLRTGHVGSFHMVGQWFPKIARLEPDGRWAHFPLHHLSEFYADFGTYDVTIDVPAAFTVGATGRLVESRVQDGRRIERHVQHDIHDFAWTAWDKYKVARETVDGVDVTLLYPPGYAHLASRELATLRFALPYYSARYGRYPYDVLTVVHPPPDADEAGGMEYPTLITSGGAWWTPSGVLAPEIVTIHELGHQWFYGIVATNEFAWPVLDEGLNQFAEVDAMAKWRGEASLVDFGGLHVSDAAVQAVGGNMGAFDEPIAQAASAFSSGTAYQRLVYARTASIFLTLARVYGDEQVARALGRYTRQYRFAHPAPEQLIDAFREVMGATVASTLRAALFDKGWVDYAVDGVWTHEAQRVGGVFDRDGKREKIEPGASDAGGWDCAVLVRRRGTLSLPVDVEFAFADGSTRRERWDDGKDWRRFVWRSSVALSAAVVDPDDRVLIDMNLGNNHGAALEGTRWAPRVLERATYWMQLALQALSP